MEYENIIEKNDIEEIIVASDENGETIVVEEIGGSTSGGTNNYNDLIFKPKINGVELQGNKTSKELNINAETIEFTDGETFQEKYNNGELKGEKGDVGEQGIQGPEGKPGKDGYTPIKGIDYFDGEIGPQGPKGDKGDKGDTGNTGPQGIQGVQGPAGTNGTNGKDGVTPTLKVGTTTTGEAGTNANVTMNQNGNEYTLNFTIPKGKDGTGGSGGDVDLSEYAKKTELPTKTSQLTNDSKYITNDITTDFNIDGKIYLNTVGSSVNSSTSSRIVFGDSSTAYSWIASNTAGAFSFSKGDGNILVYPKTSQYNCIMTDCASDLGRSDKHWKDLYLSGVLNDGTNSIAIKNIANKSSIPTKTSQLTNDSGYLTSHQSLSNYYTKSEVEALFNSITNGNEVSY